LKDRKILYQLDLDSRQSFRSLGKKVGLSKDVVSNRVKKLQENGVIKGYHAVIDYPKLGYNVYRFYFSFQNVTPDLKKEIISYFKKDKYANDVISLEGKYDLLVVIFVQNYPQAHEFWQNSLKKYGRYFSKRVFTAFSQGDYYANGFLINEKESKPKKIHQWYDRGERIKIDDLDFNVIKQISENTRVSTIEIAKALETTTTVVNYRLKKLIESAIIIAYRLDIDFQKIGYFVYKVDIELNEFDKIEHILEYLYSIPFFVYICKSIGYVDLEVGFILRNTYQLHQIMEDIANKFPNAIKNYTYFSVIKTHKTYGF
jgi:DNA-binding Lrp family transcriptional regulator